MVRHVRATGRRRRRRRPAVPTRDVADQRHFVHIPVAFVLAALVPLLLFLQADFLGLDIIKETPRANDGEREREISNGRGRMGIRDDATDQKSSWAMRIQTTADGGEGEP